MPLYDYKCTKCGREFEEIAPIGARFDMISPCCGVIAALLMSTPKDHTFKPFWHEDFGDKPVLVTSKNHYKDLCKKHGVYAKHEFGTSWNISEV